MSGAGSEVVTGAGGRRRRAAGAEAVVADGRRRGGRGVTARPAGPVVVAAELLVDVDDSGLFPSDESQPPEQAVAARARMRSRTRRFTGAHPRAAA